MVVTKENFSQLNSWGRWFGEKFLKLKTYYFHFVDWPSLNGFHWFFWCPFKVLWVKRSILQTKLKFRWEIKFWFERIVSEQLRSARPEVSKWKNRRWKKTLGIFGRSSSISLCRACFREERKTFSIIPFFPDFHRSQHRHYPGKTFPILITF